MSRAAATPWRASSDGASPWPPYAPPRGPDRPRRRSAAAQLLGPVQSFAGQCEPDPECHQPLLGAVVQVVLDAFALGRSDFANRSCDARSCPSRLPFSTARTVAEVAARTSSGFSASASSMIIAATGCPPRRDSTRERPLRGPARRARPVGLTVAPGRRVPIADSHQRVIERRRDRAAPLPRRRARQQLLEQPSA